jgi:hypothetical protein
LPDLDKNQGAIRLPHDQINFSAAATGRPKIRLQPAQSFALQITQGQRLCLIAKALGGNLLPADPSSATVRPTGNLCGFPH